MIIKNLLTEMCENEHREEDKMESIRQEERTINGFKDADNTMQIKEKEIAATKSKMRQNLENGEDVCKGIFCDECHLGWGDIDCKDSVKQYLKDEDYLLKKVLYNKENNNPLCEGLACGMCLEYSKDIYKDYYDCNEKLLKIAEDKYGKVVPKKMKWYNEEKCKDKSPNKVIYLAGDLCKKGNVLLREKEAEYIRNFPQLQVYSPIEDKEINDKKNQTAESNKYLCDKIYKKDMTAIRESEYIIMDVDNDSVGTITELGAIAEFNWFYDQLTGVLKNNIDTSIAENLVELLKKYPKKKVYFHNSDIRNTELPEQGMFRSYSLNQFSHGAIRFLNKEGVEDSFETCVDKILKDGRPEWIECVHGLYQCPWDETVFSTDMYGENSFSVDELCGKKD